MTRLTDEQVRQIYHVLISKSWQSADLFEEFQAAWKAVAEILEVDHIDENGHGLVHWRPS
jgi:hypothetical protein